MEPFFSIIIPTKCRPKLIEITLCSLKKQSFKDFEVIVSDDYEMESCKWVFDKYADERFKYVHPPKDLQLGMCGNWEYGLQFAKGKYIGYLQDKMYLYKDSLEKIYQCICGEKYPDVVNWNWDFYILNNEKKSFKGMLRKKKRTGLWDVIDPIEAIKEKVEFGCYSYQRDGAPGIGSLLSGVVKVEVIEHLRNKYGNVFNFYNPDYGPPISILNFSNKAVMMRDNFSVLIPSLTSEGSRHQKYYLAAIEFQEKSPCGYKRLECATVPFFRGTNTNMVTADYNYSISSIPRLEKYLCNKLNVLIAMKIELNRGIIYPDYETEKKEMARFNKALSALSKEELGIYRQQVMLCEKKDTVSLIRRWYVNIFPVELRNKITILKNKRGAKQYKVFDTPQKSVDWI